MLERCFCGLFFGQACERRSTGEYCRNAESGDLCFGKTNWERGASGRIGARFRGEIGTVSGSDIFEIGDSGTKSVVAEGRGYTGWLRFVLSAIISTGCARKMRVNGEVGGDGDSGFEWVASDGIIFVTTLKVLPVIYWVSYVTLRNHKPSRNIAVVQFYVRTSNV